MEKNCHNYKDILNDTRTFNTFLSLERKQRLPFIDTQTGIAQNDCNLWHSQDERQYVHRTDGSSAKLYCYPAQRWHKSRREYLLNQTSMEKHNNELQTSQIPSDITGSALSFQPPAVHFGSPPYNCNIIKSINGHHMTQPPPRADSTGSHSCVDSDSRDQSSATSQSVDSPRGALDDEHLCNNLDVHFTMNNKHDDLVGEPKHVRGIIKSEDSSCTDSQVTKGYDVRDFDHKDQQKLREQTREAIRWHSMMSRNKNAGQSLIKPKSLLVKTSNQKTKISTKNRQNKSTYNENNNNNNNDHEHIQPREPKSDTPPEAMILDGERPYICSICDHSYKTRPGLSYHFSHTHNKRLPRTLPKEIKTETNINSNGQIVKPSRDSSGKKEQSILLKGVDRKRGDSKSPTEFDDQSSADDDTDGNTTETETPTCQAEISTIDDGVMISSDHLYGLTIDGKSSTSSSSEIQSNCSTENNNVHDDNNNNADRGVHHEDNVGTMSTSSELNEERKVRQRQNPFCDFCHGTVDKNRRTRLPEELISCSSCGSSGHPSCLRFSDNITLSVRKYDWQCIECKTCSTCDMADNEHQLLFCDDCDRSYHTYCLDPPLNELPEGNWSCKLCLVEYYTNGSSQITKVN